MNILFVTDLCPTNDSERGLPSVLLAFIEDFISLGHNVTLLRPNVVPNVLLRGRKVLAEGEFVWQGIKIINKNFLTPFFNERQFSFLKNEKFDFILSHMPSGILAANKISKVLGIPYFASVHASDITVIENVKYCFLKNQMKQAYLEAKGVMARSCWLYDKIIKLFPFCSDKTFLIPSGIDPKFIINDDEIAQKAENFYGIPYKIFCASSLIKRKNLTTLIYALSKIDNIELQIAGEGALYGSLRALIKRLGADKKIKLLGKKSREEILQIMKNSSIFILPSFNETFGMVYLEALASACIVVCSKDFGMSGFIEDCKNGFLVGNTSDEIKSTIEKILKIENPLEIMRQAQATAKSMQRVDMAKNYLNHVQKFLV